MSDSQSPSASVQLSESDDLGVIQESVLHDSSSGVGSVQTGFLLRNLDLLVTSISQKYNIERLQVGLGLLLLFLFTFFCLCIAIAWKYYSPVISNYTVKEQEERKRLKMDAFKNFLSKKKVDKHFKRSGPGQRLDSGSAAAPSITAGAAQGGRIDRVAASDIAAQAALKRLYKAEPQISSSQKKIQMIAQRELEEERRRRVQEADLSALTVEERRGPETKEFEHADVIKGVHFTCELLGEDEAMTKPDLMEALEDFLKTQLSCQNEDAVIPAVLLIYSLNKKPVREAAVETIGKYLQNIIENPDEPKYRRIRISNKVFQERVACVKGAREFLSAVGFEEKMEPAKEGAAPESFLVVSERTVNDVGRIVDALSMLREGQSVPIKVSRDTTVYRIGENERITMPRLPPDFYDLTAEELKKEQRAKTEEVDRMLTLRTREMREKDEKQRQYTYKYTLIRIRLPDRYVLQGVFGCHEPLSAVREYTAKHLSNQAALFSLYNPCRGSEPLVDETKSLAALGLAPAVVLHFEFDEPSDGPSLSQEFVEAAVPLTPA
ncbi:hypothetical protein Q1695_006440 [Nippostrongylus brasiliensis]|nr:hypothetical protein Q1695_006440 [Nippostrongylus brasiliensis]